jgi:hypothetical protein
VFFVEDIFSELPPPEKDAPLEVWLESSKGLAAMFSH